MGPQKIIYDPVLHVRVPSLDMVPQLQGVNKLNQYVADLWGNGALRLACKGLSRMGQSGVGAWLRSNVAALGGSSGRSRSVPVNLPATASPDKATGKPPPLFDHHHTYTRGSCYLSDTYVLQQ